MWALEFKPWSCGRAASALHHWALWTLSVGDYLAGDSASLQKGLSWQPLPPIDEANQMKPQNSWDRDTLILLLLGLCQAEEKENRGGGCCL